MLDILIVSYNTRHLLEPMLEACKASHGGLNPRYLVVDNASTDGSVDELHRLGITENLVVNSNNIGFGRANNQLVELLEGEYVLLLNTDAFVQPNALVDSIRFMNQNPDCGVLGLRLTGKDGELQPSCRLFPTPFNSFLARARINKFIPWAKVVDSLGWAPDQAIECDWVPGCFYLVRKRVIDEVGLFDPRFFLYCEEVDHCKRVKSAGWKVMYSPHSSVVHLGGESAKSKGELTHVGRQLSAVQIESELLYFRKHHGWQGVVLHLILSPIADLVLASKDIIKRRGVKSAANQFLNTYNVYLTWVKTAFASKCTR